MTPDDIAAASRQTLSEYQYRALGAATRQWFSLRRWDREHQVWRLLNGEPAPVVMPTQPGKPSLFDVEVPA
jgi:hypothetical protein